jgi:DNA-binding Lrp family transcriptional regulator
MHNMLGNWHRETPERLPQSGITTRIAYAVKDCGVLQYYCKYGCNGYRVGMDKIDRKLLNLMQRDASRTNVDMSEEVGLSPSSCLRRLQRLRKSGVIDRIVAILNPAKAGRVIKALVTVELKLHGDQHMRRFLATAVAEEAVSHAYAVTGEVDVVLMLRLHDMEEFDSLCDRLFRDQNNIARFFTMMIIRTGKEETAIRL